MGRQGAGGVNGLLAPVRNDLRSAGKTPGATTWSDVS